MLSGRRVLIVEDEIVICMMIEDMLTAFGCHIVGPATRLEQAQTLAAKATIDLAILDVNLNGKASLPVADLLQARGIPFIFASGYGTEGLGAHSGATVVEKPFQERELERALENVLEASERSPTRDTPELKR